MANPNLTPREKVMLRYSLRGQLKTVFAVDPNPRKEGRTIAHVIMASDAPALREGARSQEGWQVVVTAPSTKLTRYLLGMEKS